MHSAETETIEEPVAKTQENSPPDTAGAPTNAFATFADRHIGPSPEETAQMLRDVGFADLDALVAATVPKNIRLDRSLQLPAAKSENDALVELRALASQNRIARNFIGAGYSDTITPPVIQRNILENPGWYTAYTPYQAELAQGRLEALVNFQTMVTDLTALDIANASLLDEATAAAEAMALCHHAATDRSRNRFFVADNCHPQTIEVVRTRAKPLGIEIVVGDFQRFDFDVAQVSNLRTETGKLETCPTFLAHSCNIPPRMERFTITKSSQERRTTQALCLWSRPIFSRSLC